MLVENDDAALAGAAWVGCPATDLIAGCAGDCASGLREWVTRCVTSTYFLLFPLAYCAAIVAMHP